MPVLISKSIYRQNHMGNGSSNESHCCTAVTSQQYCLFLDHVDCPEVEFVEVYSTVFVDRREIESAASEPTWLIGVK